jgi:hypothetical protein
VITAAVDHRGGCGHWDEQGERLLQRCSALVGKNELMRASSKKRMHMSLNEPLNSRSKEPGRSGLKEFMRFLCSFVEESISGGNE